MNNSQIEFGVRHYAYNGITDEFYTLAEAVEWINQREEPDEWRLYKRHVTEWEEIE